MQTPADAAATPYSDLQKSASVTPTTTSDFGAATSPSPSAVVSAAEAAMLVNASLDNNNQLNEMIASANNLSESDIKMLVLALNDERHRDEALFLLSNVASCRSGRPFDLAPVLWNTSGIVLILLKEVLSAYYILDKEDCLKLRVGRVVNAICLLQTIGMHSAFRKLFVKAQIPAYVYPFLRLRESSPSIEKLRVASLGVVGGLVKTYDSEAIHYLLDSEVFPCCLCSLEFGNQFAKSVVAFIIFKLLSSKEGLRYCWTVSERFLSVLQVFLKIVEQTSQLNENTIKLFRFVVGSYVAFTEIPRACGYLRSYFPSKFSNVHFLTQLGKVEPKLYGDLMRLHDKINEVTHMGLPVIGFGFDSQC